MKTKLLIATMFFGITTLFAQNIPSYVPANGLVGWWPFNGNANDESGNGNNGTVNGAKLTSDRNGKSNSAYSFDGIFNNISIPNSSALYNISQITISAWININQWDLQNNQGYFPIISKTNSSSYGKYRLGLYTNLNNEPSIYGNLSNNAIGISQKNLYSLNKWIHIVASISNGSFKISINGQQVINGTTSNTGWSTTDNLPLLIGKDIPGSIDYANGKIDDIAIYNRALSDQEVKMLFNGCSKETATSNSFNSPLYTTSSTVSLSAQPNGGVFSGNAITANAFDPSKAKLGKNTIKYNFKNTSGCSDSTIFSFIVVDTLGNTCSTYDTLKINVKLTTGIKANQFTSINVYPNPTSDILIISANDLDALSGYTYKIVDALGKLVYSKSIQNTNTQIPLSSFGAKGTYLLQIIDASGAMIEVKHIVLQ